jgi:Tfp pilus assembly protein PilO
MNLSLLQRRLSQRLSQIGSPGWIGLLMLVVTAGLWFGLVLPGEDNLVSVAHKVHLQKARQGNQRTLGQNVELSKEELLDLFYHHFPAPAKVPDILKGIYEAASKNGLSVDTADYGITATDSDRLARYRAAMPIKGSYKQIMGFMNQVLKDAPNTALESVSFKRDKVDDAVIEAKLVFLIFVEAHP